MRISLLLLLLLIGVSCKKNSLPFCLCSSYAQPLRIALLNDQDENLLRPGTLREMKIDQLKLKTGQKIDFVIKDYIVQSEPIGFYHLQSASPTFYHYCVDQECEIYITYSNFPDIDTVNVLIEKETFVNSNGCDCVSYPLRYIKHNGQEITEFDWAPNNTGSAIIRK